MKGYSKRLKFLAKHTDLEDPEAVKQFIAGQEKWSNCYKEGVVNAYVHYARFFGFSWVKCARAEQYLDIKLLNTYL